MKRVLQNIDEKAAEGLRIDCSVVPQENALYNERSRCKFGQEDAVGTNLALH
jgi:hypothetical protein